MNNATSRAAAYTPRDPYYVYRPVLDLIGTTEGTHRVISHITLRDPPKRTPGATGQSRRGNEVAPGIFRVSGMPSSDDTLVPLIRLLPLRQMPSQNLETAVAYIGLIAVQA
jgi:hypothetical protein